MNQDQAGERTVVASEQREESEPTPQRQTDLRVAYQDNTTRGRPPYAGVELHTRAELLWIMHERQWTGTPASSADQGRVDLRQCTLSGLDLRDMYLRYLDLSDASLEGVHFDNAFLERSTFHGAFFIRGTSLAGAILEGANLSQTYFHKTDLSATDLVGARLTNARLIRASVRSAILSRADLRGAYLSGVDLRGTNLSATRMNYRTVLHRVIFDSNTRLRDVIWADASLADIDWKKLDRVGEEAIAHARGAHHARGARGARKVAAYRIAARTYHDLVRALQAQGLSAPASKFRLREQQMERKAFFWNRELIPWAFSYVLNLVAGYGERPGRTLGVYSFMVLLFAACYYAITNRLFPPLSTSTGPLPFLDAIVLSITSFHGRGLFQPSRTFGDPIQLISAVEAIFGLFIEAIFVATFSRRFLSD